VGAFLWVIFCYLVKESVVDLHVRVQRKDAVQLKWKCSATYLGAYSQKL